MWAAPSFSIFQEFPLLREAGRIRREIARLNPDVVVNFYDVVGALALKKYLHQSEELALATIFSSIWTDTGAREEIRCTNAFSGFIPARDELL